MAALLGKRFFAAVILIISVILGELYVLTLRWETKAIIFRAHYVLLIETVLLILSSFVWRNFRTLFKSNVCAHDQSHVAESQIHDHADFIDNKHLKHNSHRHSDVKIVDNRASGINGTVLHKDWHVWKKVLFCYLFLCHISYFTNLLFIGKDPYLMVMICYGALGSLFQLVTGMCFIKLVGFLNKYILKRHFCLSTKYKLTLAVVYSLLASSYGLYNATLPPTIKTVPISVKGLPENLEGLTIVQLSDIHLGPTVGRHKMQQIVDLVNQLNADILVLTGDLVDGSVARLKQAAEPLINIQAKHGKYFISGNHEYYTGDVDNWFDYLRTLGFTVLHNSNVKLPSNIDARQQICLAGTDDLQAEKIGYGNHGMHLEKALGTCLPNQPAILLAHQPKAAKIALDSKYRVDLVISGHTHGGQMFPFMIPAYLINPFYAGLYKYGKDSHVYVSMGTQYWGIPMRILTTMEITQLIMTRKILK
ncbi:transmembrane protein with metallophosphoesterase domain-like [Gigantopelta aegis]|uniref:transmembrane protein with metallophosphoesterase domain-like n=1 Tax=Gigantopelta aegis TaxID=1735272 RepID=UPI001B88A87A|nr:transmembrane protein with metallophosphoesterase domain-like [Gigantopelta aegis]